MKRPRILQAPIIILFVCFPLLFAHAGDGPCDIPGQFSRERPDPEGVPTRVEVGLFVNDIIEINNKDGTSVNRVGVT